MKWYYVVFFIFFIVISCATIYKAVMPHNYNENGVSFNYPGTWIKLNPNQLNNTNESTNSDLVAVGDPNSAHSGNIIVIVQRTEKVGNLDEIVEASKAELAKDWGAVVLSDNIIKVDRRYAHDIIYTTDSRSNKKQRMVIFDKNEMVYCIILGGSISAFDGQKDNFDMIVNSFKVTE
jgi:hypothetical protein